MTDKSPLSAHRSVSLGSAQAPARVALFSGSFDPFTIGHADIVNRAANMFDKLVIAVAVNPEKHYMFSAEERVRQIKKIYQDDPRITVIANSGMTVDIAKKVGAKYQVRGVRSAIDFEYEKIQAEYNFRLGGLETVLLYSKPQYAAISSTAYRELVYFHKDEEAKKMLPHL